MADVGRPRGKVPYMRGTSDGPERTRSTSERRLAERDAARRVKARRAKARAARAARKRNR
jgi:hypothetical protein